MKSVFILLLAILAVRANDFYVGQDGATLPCGSSTNPCATMALALSQMSDGDQMVLLPGTLKGDGNGNLVVNISIQINSPSQNTTIDLQKNGRAFTFSSSLISMSGITITSGYVLDFYPGSAIAFYGSELRIDSCQFLNNTWASPDDNDTDPFPAGAIYIDSGLAVITNSRFYLNRADWKIGEGGAISVGNANLNVSNCYFQSNVAATGGAIYSLDNSLDVHSIIGISNTTFYHNIAHLGGGAIRNDGNVFAYIDNCQFEHNIVVGWGGAYYGHNVLVYITNSKFYNNTGESNGGAIYLEQFSGATLTNVIVDTAYTTGYTGGCACIISSELIATDSLFTNCFAFNEGGGFYVVADPSQLILTRVNITNCDAGEGGAIFMDQFAKVFLTDVLITNNTADDSGGGIYCAEATITIKGNTIIEGNTAANSFGGLADNFFCEGEPDYYFCEIEGDKTWKSECVANGLSSNWVWWLDGIPKWAVVLFGLGVVLILLFLVVCGVCIVRQTRRKKEEDKKTAFKKLLKKADEEELLNDYDE